jgi:stress response protein YsnF
MIPKEIQATDQILHAREDEDQILIPLHAEEVSVSKRRIVTSEVKVATVTRQHEQLVEELLAREHVEIERIAIGKEIDKAPAVREEGDTLVIPIVEEVVVVERHLLLKEEVRIHRIRETQRYQERVVVRKQEAVITRLPADTNQVAAASEAKAEQK